MKITATLLSIPPYLSTTWKNISSLQAREVNHSFTLLVSLQNGTHIEIPSLSKEIMEQIFEAHAKATQPSPLPLEGPFSFSLPLQGDNSLGTLGSSMQHNPDQADLAPLPPEVLNKIKMITRAFGLEDTSLLPKAEPHCNCIYCQIARSLQGEEALSEQIAGEEVSEEDLKFRSWEIEQTSEKLYIVTNPLDTNEHYQVFLGSPLGCTCGSKSCEHIRAVLNS